MFRCFVYAIGLAAGLVPTIGYAQTSIDAGKSPSEIFATVCATCHKSARGLANGRGTSGLASFLAEHYTSGKDQAAQLAAYVMGAGGGEAAPAARKPAPDSNRAAGEEAKPGQQRQKPEPAGASAKLQPPASEDKPRSGDVPSIVQERGRKPAAGRREEPATASRGKPAPEPEVKPAAAPPEPAQAAVEQPKPPVQESPAAPAPAATPANADAGASAPVPRDNIPD